MLDLRKYSQDAAGLELVILNACNSKVAGLRFTKSGVPHVLCTVASVKDSWSHLFLHKLYTCLFHGDTVGAAFQAARVALSSDPNVPLDAAHAFCLLPEDEPHDEVLFPFNASVAPKKESSAFDTIPKACASELDDIANDTDVEMHQSRVQKSEVGLMSPQPAMPFNRPVPRLPEDFIGRAVDVWTVQQHLISRRVVVVCGGLTTGQGIGKSSVMDAVHRAFTLQLGATCVAIKLQEQGHVCENYAASKVGCRCWVAQLREAVQRMIADVGFDDSTGMSRHCAGSRRCLRQSRYNVHASGTASMSGPHASSCGGCFSSATTVDSALDSLVADMQVLARASREQRSGGEWWPAVAANGPFAGGPAAGEGGGALLILDNCDRLVQQQYFQEAIADILRRCPGYRVLLSTQRPLGMVGPAWYQFKAVHHHVEGLASPDAARLFLRRTHRALRWEELSSPEEAASVGTDPGAQVIMTSGNEAAILELVAKHPAVAAQRGNPRALIELANNVNCSLASLQSISSVSLVVAPPQGGQNFALPPKQGVMTPRS